jgi:hypothetical protein
VIFKVRRRGSRSIPFERSDQAKSQSVEISSVSGRWAEPQAIEGAGRKICHNGDMFSGRFSTC